MTICRTLNLSIRNFRCPFLMDFVVLLDFPLISCRCCLMLTEYCLLRLLDMLKASVANDFILVSLQPPAHAGSSLADFSTLKMEAIRSSETSVHTRSTRRHIPEDGILRFHFCSLLVIFQFLLVILLYLPLLKFDLKRIYSLVRASFGVQ
jgi:hypothetical protein